MLPLGLGIPCVFFALITTESNKKPSGTFQGDGKKADEKGISSDPERKYGA